MSNTLWRHAQRWLAWNGRSQLVFGQTLCSDTVSVAFIIWSYSIFYSKLNYKTGEDKQGKTKCDSQDRAGESRGFVNRREFRNRGMLVWSEWRASTQIRPAVWPLNTNSFFFFKHGTSSRIKSEMTFIFFSLWKGPSHPQRTFYKWWELLNVIYKLRLMGKIVGLWVQGLLS